ncbi:phasin family protein [Xanthobacter autotrophicus]|uniref:phasin family protein n=1 Tax=Xanthobacter autotrophicus TaxID=280 RepID=UPI0024A752B1|nr:phasin family protein [Xanthobacter autotrophicus]MDI4656298.1 phasin family protein [Xanthobacter autotrophicus]
MVQTADELQKISKDNIESALKSFGTLSKSAQAIAVEIADYTKTSFEQGTAALEKLLGAKTVEQAIEIQQSYLKSAYEGAVAQATKLGELYTELAKETYKPFESSLGKTGFKFPG